MFWLWAGFVALVIALLAIDLGLFHRRSHVQTVREAAKWTAVWVTLGLSFSAVVYFIYEHHLFGARLAERTDAGLSEGMEAALTYVTGYLLEESLSIDNIFVMALVMDTFRVDPLYRHRVLYWGIMGALILRATMILSGVWLVTHFAWLFYIFGLYLVWTGAKLLRSGEDAMDAENTLFVRAVRKMLPIAPENDGPRFSTRHGGRFAFTPLAVVLMVIEGTDVVFALDSVPAILAITTESFIVFTSNIFAILGLRSLYFVLQGMMGRFSHLKVSLAFILVFIGGKMIAHDLYKVPNLVSLGVIGGAVAVGVLSSILLEKKNSPATVPVERG